MAHPSILLAAAALVALPAAAQSHRCGRDLVSVGENRAAVLIKCGEPLVRDSFCKSAAPGVFQAQVGGQSRPGPAVACDMVDEWTYNPGWGQLMTTMRFEGGQLTAITYGDRVK